MEIKVNNTLYFDDKKEADIIQAVEALRQRKKLGELINQLIRQKFNAPNEIYLEPCASMTPERRRYFSKVAHELDDMRLKIKGIQEEVQKLTILAMMNKYLGFEEKAENLAKANFVLSRQLNSLAYMLGVPLECLFDKEAEGFKDMEREKAEKALEFIIAAYDDVVTSFRKEPEQPDSETLRLLSVIKSAEASIKGDSKEDNESWVEIVNKLSGEEPKEKPDSSTEKDKMYLKEEETDCRFDAEAFGADKVAYNMLLNMLEGSK